MDELEMTPVETFENTETVSAVTALITVAVVGVITLEAYRCYRWVKIKVQNRKAAATPNAVEVL